MSKVYQEVVKYAQLLKKETFTNQKWIYVDNKLNVHLIDDLPDEYYQKTDILLVANPYLYLKEINGGKEPSKKDLDMFVLKKSDKRNQLSDCLDMYDPVSTTEFKDLLDLNDIVKLGKGEKKNCYEFDTMYRIYKDSARAGKRVENPMTREELTKNEREHMIAVMKKKKLNVPKKIGEDDTIELNFVNWTITNQLSGIKKQAVRIYLTENDVDIGRIGYIPNYFYINDTYNTKEVKRLLLQAWNKHMLFINGTRCCSVRLVETSDSYMFVDEYQLVMDMVDELKRLLR